MLTVCTENIHERMVLTVSWLLFIVSLRRNMFWTQENVTRSHIAHYKTQNTRGGSLFTYGINSYQHRTQRLFICTCCTCSSCCTYTHTTSLILFHWSFYCTLIILLHFPIPLLYCTIILWISHSHTCTQTHYLALFNNLMEVGMKDNLYLFNLQFGTLYIFPKGNNSY